MTAAAHDFDWSRVRAGLVRLITLAGAAFALLTTVMLPQLVDGGESTLVLMTCALGMCIAAGATVGLTALVAVQRIVSVRPKPIRFDWTAELDLDGPAVVVEHGPVRPPFGTPERAAYDLDVTS